MAFVAGDNCQSRRGLGRWLELLMRGTVDYDYLLTVFVFALLASSVVGAMFIAFLDRQGMEYFPLPISEAPSRLTQQPSGNLPDGADDGGHAPQATIVAAKQWFMTHLERATAASARTHQCGALLRIHMGNFASMEPEVVAKDLLAQQIAQRIALCVRKSDTVVQVNEQEFAVLLEALVRI